MNRVPRILLTGALFVIGAAVVAAPLPAQSPTVTAVPVDETPVAAPVPENPWNEHTRRALQFAQQDAARAQVLLSQAKAVVESTAAALTAAQTDVARLAEISAKSADDAKAVAAELAAANQQVKTQTDLQAAAAQKLKIAQEQAEKLASLAAFYEQTPPTADASLTREISVFKHDRPMNSCWFDPAGVALFAGAQDPGLHRRDLISGDASRYEGHRSWIQQFVDIDDGTQFVTAGFDGQLTFWKMDGAAASVVRTIAAHKGFCRTVALSPDGTLLASGGNDKFVRIWSADDGRLIAEIPGHANHIYNVRFSPDGTSVVSGDLLGVLKVWETGTWKHLRDMETGDALHKYDTTFRADCGGIRGMAFSPDGTQLVVGGIGKVTNAFAGIGEPTAVLYDYASGKRLKVMTVDAATRGAIWGLCWHPSGKWIVATGGGTSGELWYWNPGDEKPFQTVKLPSVSYDVALHPDGIRLAVALYDNTVRMYSLGPKTQAELEADKAKKAAPPKK